MMSKVASFPRDGYDLVSIERSMDGFQLGCGRSKMVNRQEVEDKIKFKNTLGLGLRVPFHIPYIKRPQDEYRIVVNNVNQPFDHVWLERTEDGSTFIHPLEKLTVLDFVDKNVGNMKPIKPSSIESTPFKLIQEVKDLRELSSTLHGINEFAVDLENNQYRSFQGLTCLMQISTRTEDFIIDTLKLHVHIGPYLREIFKDPTKKKVMHGAENDILWLQRDFGIYICNLFDTGQASRVLRLERNSLEYLLYHFCQVSANKEYQNADWRLRPLPNEMLRYAREDTHYLLYIYDLLKFELAKMQHDPEIIGDRLLEAYERSYDVCMKLYEKELQTENSFLHIYGLRGLHFKAKQLAIVAGLFEWRDVVARAEDESTGYVLPNKTLLEIGKEMPNTICKLRQLLNSKHPYVEQNIGAVFSIVFHAMHDVSAFEAVAEQLKNNVPDVVEEEWIPVEGTPMSTNTETENPITGSHQVSITVNSGATPDVEENRTACVINPYTLFGHRGLRGNDGNTNRSYGCAPRITIKIPVVPISSGTEIVETTSGQFAELSASIQASKRHDASVAMLGTCVEVGTIKALQDHDGLAPPSEASGAGTSKDIIALEDETIRDKITNVNDGVVSADADKTVQQEDNGGGNLATTISVIAFSGLPNDLKEPAILRLQKIIRLLVATQKEKPSAQLLLLSNSAE